MAGSVLGVRFEGVIDSESQRRASGGAHFLEPATVRKVDLDQPFGG